jgi:diaminohydroxyphosphoribosylaminopyrimidine deaminase / 5-amino-6-(5-phosphoribosylamino)uracil reductase
VNTLTIHYLKKALCLAELRRGFCAPNPSVGAVLVKNGQMIAEAYHWASGFPHAEAEILNTMDAKLAHGATLYVTLQPCCHTNKKTPPCTRLIIEKKLSKVIYGFRDPNPAVGNHSDAELECAGIACIHHPIPEITRFYLSYQFWWQHHRPFVTAKLAISLDGKIAGSQGQRLQLTGEATQQFTHEQRLRSDALLTTAKTILHDNPLLNVRIGEHTYAKPLYILDKNLNTPVSANIFNSASQITLFHDRDLSSQCEKKFFCHQNKTRCFPLPTYAGGFNLVELLRQIGKAGYHDLWVEAGGLCFQAFAQEQLLQRAFIYVAPRWLGQRAQNAFSSARVLHHAKCTPPFSLGTDACFEFNWYVK